MKKLLLVIPLILLPLSANAAIAFDTSSSHIMHNNVVTTDNSSTVTTANANETIFIGWWVAANADSVSSVKCNGNAATFEASTTDIHNGYASYAYIYNASTAQAYSCDIVFAASAGNGIYVQAYSGTNQVTTVDATSTSNNGGVTSSSVYLAFTTKTNNDWIVGSGATGGCNPASAGVGTTLRENDTVVGIGADASFDANKAETPAGTYSIGLTAGCTDYWAASGVALNPATSTPASASPSNLVIANSTVYFARGIINIK